MQKYDDAMSSNFSGLSKNVRYQKQPWDDLIKWHPSFWARGSQHSKGKEICPKGDLVQILAWKHNHIKEPSQRRFDGGYEIMSTCITFEISVPNSYAQSSSITSEQENLTTTSIRSWLQATVSKLKFVAIWSEIWLRVKYQKCRGHPYLSNGIYLPWFDQRFGFYDFLHDDRFVENCNSEQTTVTREKLNLGLFGWDSFPELNTKKLDNSPRFPLIIYTASLDQRFRRYRILRIGKTAENWTGQYNSWKKQNSYG
jgi:hypothetical protein